MKPDKIQLRPIGVIKTPFSKSAGAPIQSAMGRGVKGEVVVFEEYAEALTDLEGFERIWLIYWMDRARQWRPMVVPYLDDKPRGLFSTRAPARPNPIGISAVRLVAVRDNTLQVEDVDMLDGTPLLDIKPYSRRFDRFDVQRSGWLDAVNEEQRLSDNRFDKDSEGKAR